MKFENLIPKIVSGFDIAKDNIVLLQLWGENADLPMLDRFAIEVAKAGGIPVKWQYSREFIKEYFSAVPPENLKYPDKYFDLFKPADIVIDILTYSPEPARGFPKDKLPFYGQFMQRLFKELTQKKYFIQVKVPTAERAAEEGIEYQTFRDAVLGAMDIDYRAVKSNCTLLAETFKGADSVRIHTKAGVFSCSVKGREWGKDDGMGDVPCGEVGIPPIEESGEGQLFVPELFIEGKKYSGITLTFSQGRLVNTTDPKILEYIKSAPGDCDMLAEFGIGLNPGVTTLTGYIGTDEKCIGTVHVAVGFNYPDGGKNKSPLHMDFLIRPDKVEIDGKTVMAGGKFADWIKIIQKKT